MNSEFEVSIKELTEIFTELNAGQPEMKYLEHATKYWRSLSESALEQELVATRIFRAREQAKKT